MGGRTIGTGSSAHDDRLVDLARRLLDGEAIDWEKEGIAESEVREGPEEDGLTRGSIDMPSFWNLDLTIGKLWKIKNRVGIELRADIFNVFNQQPVLTIQDRSTDTFREPVSRQAPRSVRLYGTVRF